MSAARTTYETLLVELDRGVALVTLNRPDQLNTFNRQMTGDLFDALAGLEADESVRAVVVTGAGRAFSAGADIDGGFGEKAGDVGADGAAPRPSALDVRPWEMQTPILAAINGAAGGMGLTYPLMWDIRIAAEDAKLGLAEVKRGLIPGAGGTQRLSRAVGVAKALEICLTGDNVTGSEAHKLGLVNMVVPSGDVLKAAEELANRILKGAPMSVAFIKEAIKKGVELSLDEGLRLEADLSAMIATTEDSKEGPRAFAEKRAPVWKGK